MKALVLEGGSLRCMFTAGVVDMLLEKGILFDGVFGVSAGALTGVNYVSKQPGRTARINLDYVNDKRYLGLRNLLLHKSIFNFDFLFGEICDTLVPLDRETFHASPCAFTAVATNCLTGQPVYREKSHYAQPQDIYPAIRASASMPLLSPMVSLDGIPCLDGGLSVSVPYQKPLEEGYEKILVVTTREHGYRRKLPSHSRMRLYAKAYGDYPQLLRRLVELPHRYQREMDEIDRLEVQGKIFVLRPPRPVEVSRTEKDTGKLTALYLEGRAQCEEQLESLERYLLKQS